MDAVEYLKMRRRMCESNPKSCVNCPLSLNNNGLAMACNNFEKNHTGQAVTIVEKWAAEHPIKTRQSELMKLFPNLERGPLGPCSICPQCFDTRIICPKDVGCVECCREYWLEEIEEE